MSQISLFELSVSQTEEVTGKSHYKTTLQHFFKRKKTDSKCLIFRGYMSLSLRAFWYVKCEGKAKINKSTQ